MGAQRMTYRVIETIKGIIDEKLTAVLETRAEAREQFKSLTPETPEPLRKEVKDKYFQANTDYAKVSTAWEEFMRHEWH